MIEIICATRLSEAEFLNTSALGASLRRLLPDPKIAGRFETAIGAIIAFDNGRPLADIYNQRITAQGPDATLVFVHDDVWIEDFYLPQRLEDALARYDVIGVAGNRKRAPRQVSWSKTGNTTLSGRVAHGSAAFAPVAVYGDTPAECELLDGVLLAARRSVLQEKGVTFDPQFDFHFYDLDFCRSARAKGLRLGTWPIAITHQSSGSLGDRWEQKRELYLKKWPD